MSKCIAIYSRKSKFTGKGESIENQIEICKQYIETHKYIFEDNNLEILIYEDEGFSGKNTSRPQLKKMLKDAKEKKFTILVCYRLDRISRSVSDFSNIMNDLEKLKIGFVSVRDNFDTSSPTGKAMMLMTAVFAQLERETIAERIRDNMYELSKTGRWLGGTTPTGYCSENIESYTIDGKRKKSCKLKIVPEEAELVTLIFDKYLETGSLSETDAYLIQNNRLSKNNINFSRFSIRGILSNPVYMTADEDAYHYITDRKMLLCSEQEEFNEINGIMAYNRTKQKDGMANKMREMEEWIISVGKHEGLIRGSKWVKVQALLDINKSKSYKKPRSNVALLSGLLFCMNCGSYMRPKSTRGRTIKGDSKFNYLCSMKEKSKRKCCDTKNPNGNLIDMAVCDELKKLNTSNSVYIKQLELLNKEILNSRNDQNSGIERYRKLLSKNESDMNALVKSLTKASGKLIEQHIFNQMEEYHEKGEQLKRQIADAELLSAKYELTNIDLESLKETLKNFATVFDLAMLEQKRYAILSIVKKVVWDGEKLHLYLFNHEENM